MLQRRSFPNNINKIFLFLSIILLAGVITMIVGFANNNLFIIYSGILITIATSFSIIFQAIILDGSKNFLYHTHRKKRF